jgi:phosphoribosylformylglycinamidine (FGAM) synthase-like enzyme
LLFGEAQGRVLVSATDCAAVLETAKKHGVPAAKIGVVRDTDVMRVRVGDRQIDSALSQLATAYHGSIPQRMSRSTAPTEVAVTAATPA